MSINLVVLSGRLTKEVEVKKTPSGKSVSTFTIAVQRDKDNADFINCVAWEKTAEVLSQYTKKGSKINVTGVLTTRNYDDAQGKKVYVTEVLVRQIELLDSKETTNSQVEQKTQESVPTTVNADDLPF